MTRPLASSQKQSTNERQPAARLHRAFIATIRGPRRSAAQKSCHPDAPERHHRLSALFAALKKAALVWGEKPDLTGIPGTGKTYSSCPPYATLGWIAVSNRV